LQQLIQQLFNDETRRLEQDVRSNNSIHGYQRIADRGDARVHCTATKAVVKRESKESSRRTKNVLADIFPQVKSYKYY